MTVDALASMITANKELGIEISETGVDKYVNDMSYKNGGRKSGSFVTSHGTTLSMQVDYFTATLDQAAMAEDLTHCLKSKTSGTRNAPFLTGATSQKPYGGSYVEIDLDNQYLWVYKGGSVVVQTPLVSGCAATGAWTPPGVFSIYYKATCTYLVGTGYRSYVNYWMPFNGGIGLHDASWRSEFGGTIYMYDGSHGCVNLPPANAGLVYNNVSAGTKVIVYGGERTAGKLTQEFTGTQSYTVTTDDMPFQLDVKVKYTGVDLHYASSHSNVVTVDGQGNVTIVGGGTATITVTSDAKGSLEKGVFEITIYVEGDPVETEPTEPDTEPTEPDTEPTEPDTEPTEPDTEPTEPETQPETEPSQAETQPETTNP